MRNRKTRTCAMEIYTVQNAQQKKAHMRNYNLYCSKCATIVKPKMRNRKTCTCAVINYRVPKRATEKRALAQRVLTRFRMRDSRTRPCAIIINKV